MPQNPTGNSSFDTNILGNWSYCNDPETSNLPSTVDMTAFKSGPNDVTNVPCNESLQSASSDSEASNSSSSDSSSSSSDTDAPSSSNPAQQRGYNENQSQQQRFSVTSSDNAGLRLKIAAIQPNEKNERKTLTSESSDCESCSDCSGDESLKNKKKPKNNKNSNKNRNRVGKVNEVRKRKRKRTTSASISSDNQSDSTDSDSSEDSLQQINEEDLAAILPPEDFPSFESAIPTQSSTTTKRTQVDTVLLCDGASSSDMELPAQLVNAAIQRAESGSETETPKNAATSQYSSSLLQEFVAKTQILNHTTQQPQNSTSSTNNEKLNDKNSVESQHSEKIVKERDKDKQESSQTETGRDATANAEVKKKRGRPKKIQNIKKLEHDNESPDSGILSNPHSPTNAVSKVTTRPKAADKSRKHSENIKTEPKINISNLERTMYATERVLYPPRNRASVKRGPGRPPKAKGLKSVSPNDKKAGLDPVWMKIDLNKKYREPKVSGYKSDYGGMVCSRTLAAQSGYVSDYGSRCRSRSGYRSDHSVKSGKSKCGYKSDCHGKRYSGYRSDYSTKSKGCGYRTDCGVGKRRTIRRKKRDLDSKRDRIRSQHNIFLEQDIMKLACLSLGQSNDDSNSNDSTATVPAVKSNLSQPAKEKSLITKGTMQSNTSKGSGNLTKNSDENFKNTHSTKKTTGSFLTDICERVSRSLAENASPRPVLKTLSPKTNVDNKKSTKNKKQSQVDVRKRSPNPFSEMLKPKAKNIKATVYKKNNFPANVSSRRSVYKSKTILSTKHKFKKHKHTKPRANLLQISKSLESKFNTEIENLIISFIKLCHISSEREKNSDSIKVMKRSKKRKPSEVGESVIVTGTKRRHKKLSISQGPDEHKLPLKKRHYLLTTSSENRSGRHLNARNQVNNSKDLKESKEKEIKEVTKPDPKDAKEQKELKALVQQAIENMPDKAPNAIELFRVHMDEAIEACINKYTTPQNNTEKNRSSSASTQKAVTPKKRHLLESPSDESKKLDSHSTTHNKTVLDVSISHSIQLKCQQTQDKKSDIVTRKKNRLEGLVSKILPNNVGQNGDAPVSKSAASVNRPSVIKATNNQESNKVPPPGVFEPSLDVELEIPITTISISTIQNAESKKALFELHKDIIDLKDNVKSNSQSKNQESDKEKSLLTVKKRRRKTINRTGFPTKKRKKKSLNEINRIVDKSKETIGIGNSIVTIANKQKCDRVPQTGEDTAAFIERSIWPKLSVVNIEKLQNNISDINIKSDGKINKFPKNSSKSRPSSPTDVLENVVLSKRQLRLKSETSTKDKLSRKRMREDSVSDSKITKKSKDTEKTKRKNQTRDNSSDNEPLICLVKAKKSNKLKSSLESLILSDNESNKTNKNNRNKDGMSNRLKSRSKSVSCTENSADSKVIEISKTESHAKCEVKIKTRSKSVSRYEEQETNTDEKLGASKMVKSDEKTKPEDGVSKGRKSRISTIAKERKREEITENQNSSKTSEISIIIPERPKSQMSISSLATPPLESSEPSEQEPLPQQEENACLSSRDDSPYNSDSTNRTSSDIGSKKKVFKWKKKYLVAGLLSDYYKDEKCSKSSEQRSSRNIIYKPEDHPYGLLPPPPYCEKFFRQTVQEFQLPFDLWWQHSNNKLPGRDTVPSWKYRKIRTNVYDARPNQICESQACSCPPDTGCADDCINRLVYTECAPESCPCKEKCKNQIIQKHEGAPALEKFMTENKGWGVRTKLPIKVGSFILEYVGEVVTENEFKQRMGNRYLRDTHHYCLHLDGGLVIDGHRMGGDGRFVNHSCAPNCEMQKWSVNGLSRMALFALRDIESGEELTYDYNFSLFNPAEGQTCKCGTKDCRGVIGGKYQRIIKCADGKTTKTTNETITQNAARVGRPRKRRVNHKVPPKTVQKDGQQMHTVISELSSRECGIVKECKCFLLRNLYRVRRIRGQHTTQQPSSTNAGTSGTVTNSINLPISRTISRSTRRLAQKVPEKYKADQLNSLYKEICTRLNSFKDDSGKTLISKLTLPSKQKDPSYYEIIKNPIDLSIIENNIGQVTYTSPQAFDSDILNLFNNAVKFYGALSPEGKASKSLKENYFSIKHSLAPKVIEMMGGNVEFSIKDFLSDATNEKAKTAPEDIIQCICGLFKDEGLMIQCASCNVWQHIECTKANPNVEKYMCEKCEPREVDLEIPLDDFTEEGYRYYLSLLRGSLQIRQSDTVYVLRDIPINPNDKTDGPVAKHTYETIDHIDYSEMDIFRVERLWKDNDGKRFVFGHHYLRPHETYHEPTRKFYSNEVVRVPLFEVVPIELVMARCWVLDPATYCRGRPVDSTERHVYICELRVDKSARLFTKISRHAYPICTKTYAFYKFDEKIKISRTYAPHDVGTLPSKPKQKRPVYEVQKKQVILQQVMPTAKTRSDKRSNLNNVVNKISKTLPPNEGHIVDLSYLLTGRGARIRRLNNNLTS